LRMIRHPACAVAAVPSFVGKLPTITNPERNATSPFPETCGAAGSKAVRADARRVRVTGASGGTCRIGYASEDLTGSLRSRLDDRESRSGNTHGRAAEKARPLRKPTYRGRRANRLSFSAISCVAILYSEGPKRKAQNRRARVSAAVPVPSRLLSNEDVATRLLIEPHLAARRVLAGQRRQKRS
jgi:hypothetical protein